MKMATYRMTTVAVIVASLAAHQARAAEDPETSWRGQPGSSHQQWRFDTGSNPHTAEICQNSPADQATVAAGQFALGWQSQLPGLGDATGFWDLGRQGRITAALPPVVTDSTDHVRYILVSVCQYQDGGIYSELATVSIAGATFVRAGVDFTEVGTIGEWTVDQSLWRVDEGVTAGPVTITAATDGSIVDVITVEAGAPTSGLARLAIRRLGAEIEVAWALELQGYVLESNAGLSNPQGWQPVAAPVTVSGNEQLVRLVAGQSAHFFRLRKP
jgi:hypothetical protein